MEARKQPLLIGDRVLLRLAVHEDVLEVIRFYKENEAHLAPFEPKREASFFSESFWRPQIEKRIAEYRDDQSFMTFLFEKKSPARIIGTINFTKFVRGSFQACYLGYNVAKASEGRGYMTEALRLAIDHVFSDLNLHRIMANYMPDNQRSANLLKRLGFEEEGRAIGYLRIDGQWRDHILASLTNANWKGYKSPLKRPAPGKPSRANRDGSAGRS